MTGWEGGERGGEGSGGATAWLEEKKVMEFGDCPAGVMSRKGAAPLAHQLRGKWGEKGGSADNPSQRNRAAGSCVYTDDPSLWDSDQTAPHRLLLSLR